MPDNAPDTSFIREGRALHEWLLDLISPEASKRQRADNVLEALYHDPVRAGTNLEDAEKQWRVKVRRAVERPDFPRRIFCVGLAATILGVHDDYLPKLDVGDAQFDRVRDRLSERLETKGPDHREDIESRYMRALCAALARPDHTSRDRQGTSSGGYMPQLVLPAIGPSILGTPEALWMLIESEQHSRLAYDALRNIGPPAAPKFLDHLIALIKRSREDGGDYGDYLALAAVGNGNVQVIELLLDAIQNWPLDGTWGAARTLHEMGESARKHSAALSTLLKLTSSGDGRRRAAAAFVLGGVARGIDDAIDPLLQLTYDEHLDDEGYGGHIVAGYAITALGEIGRQADKVVPRLIELFDTYQEFDHDFGLGHNYTRLCWALGGFKNAASLAVPGLIAILERSLRKRSVHRWFEPDVIELLVSFGSESTDAIPVLQRIEQRLIKESRIHKSSDGIDPEDDQFISSEQAKVEEAIEIITRPPS